MADASLKNRHSIEQDGRCLPAASTAPTNKSFRSDNDQYSHLNNSIYYHLFDSIINTYLIEHCGLEPNKSPYIGWDPFGHFVNLTEITKFFAPLSFPQVLDLGLRVSKLGTSSVTYEVGVFGEGKDVPAAVGGYTHVFVDSVTRKGAPISKDTKIGLQKLSASPSRSIAKL
ncbi:hypothetical protein C0995_012719 [Termitomyces sp. Mi166|nr:hypothetical protein C0995_012719 [Termitomyces sp. Mi166\